jgi:hypothetical protein
MDEKNNKNLSTQIKAPINERHLIHCYPNPSVDSNVFADVHSLCSHIPKCEGF